jgi:hypothetical protein
MYGNFKINSLKKSINDINTLQSKLTFSDTPEGKIKRKLVMENLEKLKDTHRKELSKLGIYNSTIDKIITNRPYDDLTNEIINDLQQETRNNKKQIAELEKQLLNSNERIRILEEELFKLF